MNRTGLAVPGTGDHGASLYLAICALQIHCRSSALHFVGVVPFLTQASRPRFPAVLRVGVESRIRGPGTFLVLDALEQAPRLF